MAAAAEEKVLRKIWLNSNLAYSSAAQQMSKQTGIPLKRVRFWLSTQPSYTLFRQVRKQNYPTRSYITQGIRHQYQADLVELLPFSNQNNGYKYLLTCIDIFSKYGWVEALKDKRGATVARGFTKILKRAKAPKIVQTDRGTEFLSSNFQKVLNRHGIKHFIVHSQFKAAIVERWHRTLRGRLFRYFNQNNTNKWVKRIQTIVKNYNNTKHRSIGMKPSQVNKHNEADVWMKLYVKKKASKVKNPFKQGQTVRISMAKITPYERGYHKQWTDEIFKITKVRYYKSIPTYSLEDLKGEPIHGTFYKQELQAVN